MQGGRLCSTEISGWRKSRQFSTRICHDAKREESAIQKRAPAFDAFQGVGGGELAQIRISCVFDSKDVELNEAIESEELQAQKGR